MDSYEASRSVFSRIQGLEPESASKIMGYLLIQDYGDKEMIRLAFGPESVLQSLVFKAKTHLGLLSKPQSLPSTPSFNPISRPTPLSIPSSNPWTASSSSSGFSDSPTPSSQSPSLSYASVLSNNNNRTGSASARPVDEFQLQNSVADEVFDGSPQWEEVNSGFGFGFRPCLYYQRGFCKNGNTCRYVHGDSIAAESNAVVGSPTTNNSNNLNELEQCQELLMRRKAVQQHHHFMNSSSFPAYDNKCMSFLMHQNQHIDSQRSPTGSMIMGDEMHRFGRCRFDRNEIMNPSSRQIYLTFPADSTFREEDVSNYFSIYGPVQDVRIPYQQKRMFGFVTFVYPETVKLILAKGNPHFVCDSRVLVKPYKEKGKIVEKKQQQQLESGDYSSLCSSPSSIDYDIHHGPRMFYNAAQEMLLMKKMEERASLEQAVERRMMNLQLEDMRNHHYYNHNHHRNNAQFHRSLSMGSSIPSPNALPYSPGNHKLLSEDSDLRVSEGRTSPVSGTNTLSDANSEKSEEHDLNVSIEHILPDSLFASPKKSSMADHATVFSTSSEEANEINNPSLLTNIASQESVFSKCSSFLLEPLECN